MWLEGFLVIMILVISDQLFFMQKNHHFCASKAVFALKEKKYSEARRAHVFLALNI